MFVVGTSSRVSSWVAEHHFVQASTACNLAVKPLWRQLCFNTPSTLNILAMLTVKHSTQKSLHIVMALQSDLLCQRSGRANDILFRVIRPFFLPPLPFALPANHCAKGLGHARLRMYCEHFVEPPFCKKQFYSVMMLISFAACVECNWGSYIYLTHTHLLKAGEAGLSNLFCLACTACQSSLYQSSLRQSSLCRSSLHQAV